MAHPSGLGSDKTIMDALWGVAALGLMLVLLAPVFAYQPSASQGARCIGNLRELGLALSSYASDHDNHFPANATGERNGTPGGYNDGSTWWYKKGVVGTYLPDDTTWVYDAAKGSMGGPLLTCPADVPDAGRSYAMNVWASSYDADHPSTKVTTGSGQFFDANAPDSDRLMLMLEAHAIFAARVDADVKLFARSWLGTRRTPYQRFVDDPELGAKAGQGRTFSPHAPSAIDYERHKLRVELGSEGSTLGATNVLFVDGHVALHQDSELVDYTKRTSSYVGMWSPIDAKLEAQP